MYQSCAARVGRGAAHPARHWPGVMPKARLKAVTKWGQEAKPQAAAASFIAGSQNADAQNENANYYEYSQKILVFHFSSPFEI